MSGDTKTATDDTQYALESGTDSLDSIPSYEDAAVTTGAPIEKVSPLGYHVGTWSVVFLSVGKMIGTGVFSTRKYAFLTCNGLCWRKY